MGKVIQVFTMEEKAQKYDEDKKKHQEYSRNWIKLNKERYNVVVKKYFENNRELVNTKSRMYQRDRYRKIKEQKMLDKQNEEVVTII